ncbi:hypothetical protein HG263_16465 [Pseudoalteromonas sp. JBTF-M23]|uniref:IrrE N-terminal-like domain-containing protein n=1 Tax=Pseudoalteromonas caenipelagi TaxID=2726988 RepID=A0A849VHE4_9GAMM|nr:hypothetical protein [Pseudoalteromonas caenipelagi]NOU52128.1 hypothetical protein [Pseudoalteromonas caenipelagi]
MCNDTAIILDFLTEIELPFCLTSIEGKTFLPGLKLEKGVLNIDLERLLYPGDILHEAGHVAVCEPTERHLLSGDIYKSGRKEDWMHGEEMAAIAWSAAAITHIGLPMAVVFHPYGYKGRSAHYKDLFESGDGFGVPLLKLWDMPDPVRGYPYLTKWIRDHSWY